MTAVRYLIGSADLPPTLEVVGKIPTERATQYLDNFRDPVIGSQTKRCQFAQRSWGWEMETNLPFSVNVPIPFKGMEWEPVPSVQAQSFALWKFSAGYLSTLLEASGNIDLCDAICDSLWNYTTTDAWGDRSEWMTSLDHALAIRIRSLITLKCLYDLQGELLPVSAKLLLWNDLWNILTHQKDYFPVTNHGAMVAISLVHAAILFPELNEMAQMEQGLDIAAVGRSHLERILGEMFDTDGIAAENSPEYQRYWVLLLAPFADFLAVYEVDLGDLDLTQTVERARSALSFFADTSGRLVAIGDSHSTAALTRPPEENINHVSERMGFAFYRSESTFLTVNCGSVNHSHKHCDDTSITLTLNGQPLILDAGYFGHDWNDPRVIYTKSQGAHSGLFLRQLDNLHPGRLYWPGKERISARLARETGHEFEVCGTVVIDDSIVLTRTVTVENPSLIVIRDYVDGDFERFGEAVVRFLLPAGIGLSLSDASISATIGSQGMNLLFSGQASPIRPRVWNAVSRPQYAGWISPRFGELEAANTVEVPIPYRTECTTRIALLTV